MNQIDALLWQLNEARKREQIGRDAKNVMIETLQKSPDYLSAKQEQEEAATVVENLETEIKKIINEDFSVTGNKHPHAKIEVKSFKTFKIEDAEKVLAWVKTNLADALVYDAAKVKNYAMKIGKVDGAEVGEEVRVQIASNLE